MPAVLPGLTSAKNLVLNTNTDLMPNETITSLLMAHGVRPTSGRILVARALDEANRPLTMSELEDKLVTMDKSGIFRALTLFRDHHLVHAIDSAEGTRYELCRADADGVDDDQHVHFHCIACHRTFCLTDIPVPSIALPEDYSTTAINCVLEGYCPTCSKRH